jgi:hypothetical protein
MKRRYFKTQIGLILCSIIFIAFISTSIKKDLKYKKVKMYDAVPTKSKWMVASNEKCDKSG